MKKLLKMMKPGDIVIVALLIVLSFIPVVIFSYNNMVSNGDTLTAVVSAEGEVVHEMELSDDNEQESFEYVDDAGNENIVMREGTTVHMHDANCADQLCVRQGEIAEVGETIVCLPHQFVVEISSDDPDAENDTEIDVIS